MSGSGRSDSWRGGDCGAADTQVSPAWSPAVATLPLQDG